MKKLIKNKFFVLTIVAIVVTVVYFIAQKAIDNYIFNNNDEIVSEEDVESSDLEIDNEEKNKETSDSAEMSGMICEDEMDVVLEEEIVENSMAEAESKEVQKGEKDSIEDAKESEVVEKIFVYVTGEVNNPGVVILDEGSRIADAINAAGGTTSKANISKINLVYVLDDGMKVNIPNNNDLKNEFEYITKSSGDGANDTEEHSDETSSSNNSQEYTKSYSIVNINTATQTELETLPGIGPSIALKIINYRKENGKFSSIEDLKNVSGIGEAKFEAVKKFVKI